MPPAVRHKPTPELLAAICKRLAAGESLRSICKSAEMPDRGTVVRWAEQDEEFSAAIVRARDAGFEAVAEEILAIGDAQHAVKRRDGTEFDPQVDRDKLRVHARQWYLSKLAPKRYGDRLALDADVKGSITIATGVPGVADDLV